MTVPDPGLTDLLAAHMQQATRIFALPNANADYVFREKCSCGWTADRPLESQNVQWHTHVALVVEQHTNGRIAELEGALRSVDDLIVLVLREEQRRGRPSNGTVKAITYSRNYIRAALEGEQR